MLLFLKLYERKSFVSINVEKLLIMLIAYKSDIFYEVEVRCVLLVGYMENKYNNIRNHIKVKMT
jgi:23S rRNA maturation mini-RNase III